MRSKISQSLLRSLALLCLFSFVACGSSGAADPKEAEAAKEAKAAAVAKLPKDHKVATLGAGCFWCVEELLRQREGVLIVLSGYSGGRAETANYKMVCSGLTKHAEVIQVYYDPKKTDFNKILDAFWESHDPTQLNRQGNDVGPQYRSAIFYHDDEQKKLAEASIKKLEEAKKYDKPIVTELAKLEKFYPAEAYHQDYFELHPNDPYCNNVLVPKLKKLGLDYPGKPKSEKAPETKKPE